jgi:hypothetical protein
MRHPRNDAPPIFWKTTPLGYGYNNRKSEPFVASGFYYHHQWGVTEQERTEGLPDTGPYLITNKHVVRPPNYPQPNSVIAYTRNPGKIQETTRHYIDLYKPDGEPKWRDHPENDNIDIVLIPLDFEIQETAMFHRADIVSDSSSISGGDLAEVVGYPAEMRNFHRLPIIRQALISSSYQVSYYDTPYFVIDARLHDRMSGSPVVYAPSVVDIEVDEQEIDSFGGDTVEPFQVEGFTEKKHTRLVGVHSGERLEFDDEISMEDIESDLLNRDSDPDLQDFLGELESRLENIERKTGINRVWHAKYIDEIIRNV